MGVILAELTYIPTPRFFSNFSSNGCSPIRRIPQLIPYLLTPVALTLMSFPSSYAHFAPWSLYLQNLGVHWFPVLNWNEYGQPYYTPSIDLGRAYPGLGAQLLCACILFSPGLRRVFETGPWMTWLGSVSMGIYLLHGPLMRSVLAYLVFGPKLLFDWRERRKLTAAAVAAEEAKSVAPSPLASSVSFTDSARSSIENLVSATTNTDSTATVPPFPDAQAQPDFQTPPPDFQTLQPPEFQSPPLIPQQPETPALLQPPSTLFLILLAIALYVVILLVLVQYWNKRVEPLFAKATAWTEKACLPKQPQNDGAKGLGLRLDGVGKRKDDDDGTRGEIERDRYDSEGEGRRRLNSPSSTTGSGLPLPVTAGGRRS
ncbi:hypothetical protein UCRPC4_g05338 [Phaeomoniella chlamydospora]|uniref:Acyltransferase 3 domain-containing protein n=1 Tax=Phaeomoniella chlamydospora TaxID=158046 RepID=A0A0G2GLB4_PHACM|nr:hypothetical protein UCRPC4_g05338 [Phaeomoniella chlamydospora]